MPAVGKASVVGKEEVVGWGLMGLVQGMVLGEGLGMGRDPAKAWVAGVEGNGVGGLVGALGADTVLGMVRDMGLEAVRRR